MWTIEPAVRKPASSGMTRKQLDRANAVRSPGPCQGTRATWGSSLADGLNRQGGGRERVRPGLVLRSVSRERCARTKRGWISPLPARAAMIGAAKRWKVAAEEMGLPGRPKKTCAVDD